MLGQLAHQLQKMTSCSPSGSLCLQRLRSSSQSPPLTGGQLPRGAVRALVAGYGLGLESCSFAMTPSCSSSIIPAACLER